MAKKYCYLFSEGNANMRELLGGKGANLAEMTNIGLPVPQGFTITTEACTQYYEDGREINDEIMAEINEYIVKMEEITGKKFGDKENPLLVSVRSGARASMPGMMDTILNLGLNEDVVNIIAEKSNNPRWAWDCYRRFIQMYSDVVMEVGKKYFEQLIDAMKEKKGVKQDVELTAEDLKELASQFKAEYKEKIGEDFPTDPKEQLMGAIKAVFRSWDNPRANVYRRDNDIPYSWGTAVNVQSMAFGNMGDDCGTGVAFTRDPATGAKGLFGEFLTNAQGEDVVAGIDYEYRLAGMFVGGYYGRFSGRPLWTQEAAGIIRFYLFCLFVGHRSCYGYSCLYHCSSCRRDGYRTGSRPFSDVHCRSGTYPDSW